MKINISDLLFYTMFPVIAVIAGGAAAAFRPPGARLRSSIQHFAAGIVFAAIALELLPDIMHERSASAAVFGFLIGIGLMLGVKYFTARLGSEPTDEKNSVTDGLPRAATAQPTPQNKQPLSLLITLAIDVLIDGLLIGIGFAAGGKQGVLITVALTIEIMFLGLSAAVALTQTGATRRRIVLVCTAMAALVIIGTLGGASLLGNLVGWWKEAVLSFGAAALLYLVTEELLVEAHEEPETPLLTAMFFVGFVVLLIIEMLASE